MSDTYTLPLSKANAEKLVSVSSFAVLILPKVGYELCLTTTAKNLSQTAFSDSLYLQNISGSFQLYCHSQPVSNWKEVFKGFNFCGVI